MYGGSVSVVLAALTEVDLFGNRADKDNPRLHSTLPSSITRVLTYHSYLFKGVDPASKVGISFWSAHFQGFCDRPPARKSHFLSSFALQTWISWGSQRVLNIESRGSSISPHQKRLCNPWELLNAHTSQESRNASKNKGNVDWKGYNVVALIRLFN